MNAIHSIVNMEHGFELDAARNQMGVIDAEDGDDLRLALESSATICSELCLSDAAAKIRASKEYLFDSGNAIIATSAHVELRNVREAIIRDLDKQRFIRVPSELANFLEAPDLFGKEVWTIFEAARNDMVDAGNCLAVGCDTAAVFHLMRCAEWGLRELARRLKVKIRNKGRTCPIEYGDWETVIAEIKNKIAVTRKLSAGPRKQARLEFYSDAADHCTFMKDIWRNNTAHTREPYIAAEAMLAFARVRDFMHFIANNLLKKA